MAEPWWIQEELEEHWIQRQRQDRGCWDELLAKEGVNIDGYREWSYRTPERSGHWLAYETVQKSKFGWYPKSRYYLDSYLVKVVVVDKDDRISTCYHVHWEDFDHDAVMSWPVGERKDRFRKKLRGEELAGKMDKHGVKVIFDEEN